MCLVLLNPGDKRQAKESVSSSVLHLCRVHEVQSHSDLFPILHLICTENCDQEATVTVVLSLHMGASACKYLLYAPLKGFGG